MGKSVLATLDIINLHLNKRLKKKGFKCCMFPRFLFLRQVIVPSNPIWSWNLPTEFGLTFGMTPLPTGDGTEFFFLVSASWSFEDEWEWELNTLEGSNDLLRSSCFGPPLETSEGRSLLLPLWYPLTVVQEWACKGLTELRNYTFSFTIVPNSRQAHS